MKSCRWLTWIGGILLMITNLSSSRADAVEASNAEFWVYVGTYTGEKSQGIYGFRYRPSSGEVTSLGCVAETQHPTFLAVHPEGTHLYAVNEISGFRENQGGAVSAYQVDRRTGKLTFLNQESSVGAGPCHLVVDPTGNQVLVANYGGGSVAALPLRTDGSLGSAISFVQHRGSSVNERRQKEPHAHSVRLAPDNRFAFVADLGTDRIYVYPFDTAAGLAPSAAAHSPELAPGSGPRHFTFHPGGRFAYVINELLSTITGFRYQSDEGLLQAFETVSTLPDDYSGGNSTAEILVHPNGRFLYGSNRGHDSLAIYRIDSATGRLTLVGHQSTGGQTPRNFNFDPTGTTLWVGNQNSGTVTRFRVDPETGKLTSLGDPLEVGAPVCFQFIRVQETPEED